MSEHKSAENRTKRGVRLAAIALGILAIPVGCVALSMPGPAPCYCDPGPNLGCALADYLHEQHTAFVCGGQERWGRLP